MVMPRPCGKSFLRYSSALPQAAQCDSPAPASCSLTMCSHEGQCHSAAPGSWTRSEVSQEGQSRRMFTLTSGGVANPSPRPPPPRGEGGPRTEGRYCQPSALPFLPLSLWGRGPGGGVKPSPRQPVGAEELSGELP